MSLPTCMFQWQIYSFRGESWHHSLPSFPPIFAKMAALSSSREAEHSSTRMDLSCPEFLERSRWSRCHKKTAAQWFSSEFQESTNEGPESTFARILTLKESFTENCDEVFMSWNLLSEMSATFKGRSQVLSKRTRLQVCETMESCYCWWLKC